MPNLAVKTTHDNFKLHDYFADSWTVLFSHPGKYINLLLSLIYPGYDRFYRKLNHKMIISNLVIFLEYSIGDTGDFTPVCTTELGAMGKYAHEFQERGVKLLGLSCDDIQSHKDWIKDIEAFTV